MIDLNPFAIIPSLPFNEKGETQKKAFAPAWSEIETFDCTVHQSNNKDARLPVRQEEDVYRIRHLQWIREQQGRSSDL
jgi:hypothetical protein